MRCGRDDVGLDRPGRWSRDERVPRSSGSGSTSETSLLKFLSDNKQRAMHLADALADHSLFFRVERADSESG